MAKATTAKSAIGGTGSDLAYDCDPGQSHAKKDKCVDIFVDNPVKDRAKVRMCIRLSRNASVDKIKNCRKKEQQTSPDKIPLRKKDSRNDTGKK